MVKKIIALGLTSVLAFSLAACTGGDSQASSAQASSAPAASAPANSGETYELRLVHEESEQEFQHFYATKFKELVEEKTNGQVTIDIYPVGQLGDSTNQVELLQSGGVELAINNPGAAATIIPEGNIFSLHFLMPSTREDINKVLHNGKGIEYLTGLYEAQNIHTIDWFPEGFNIWTANKPITKPEDFKGFKMRTMAAPVISKSYEAYGATPVAIPYMELYSALQLKMADGQVNPLSNTTSMKFYEVQDYLMISHPDCFIGTFCANMDFWNEFPDDLKAIVTECALGANEYMMEQNTKDEEEAIKEIVASGTEVIELTEQDMDAFKAIAEQNRNVYTDLVGQSGQELLDLFVADIEALN